MWYNNNVKREKQMETLKSFSKSFEKPLDKTAKVWYNIYVKREAKSIAPKVRD